MSHSDGKHLAAELLRGGGEGGGPLDSQRAVALREDANRTLAKVRQSSQWKKLVRTSKRTWKKLAPWRGGGAGFGCGAGVGLGITGGAGLDPTISPWGTPKFVMGVGAGCGVGIGYGFGFGVGKRWDQPFE